MTASVRKTEMANRFQQKSAISKSINISGHNVVVGGLLVCLLSGCSSTQPAAQTPVQTPPAPAVANSPPKPAAQLQPAPVQGGFERGKLLNRLQERQQAQANAQAASARPSRRAAVIHIWLSTATTVFGKLRRSGAGPLFL
jgi:hypothetical protein